MTNTILEIFWSLENIGITDTLGTRDDENALTVFGESIKFIDGRYQIVWPWKADNVVLPDNYKEAVERLRSLLKRFRTDDNLLHSYEDTLRQQGIIEVVDGTRQPELRQYMPHHPVITPGKTTTRLRIVYDASSKVRKNVTEFWKINHFVAHETIRIFMFNLVLL